MPTARHLDQPVRLGDPSPAGAFANAFRILSSTDTSCVLEFLIFSPSTGKAYVVRRVRLHREFVPMVKSEIARSLRL